MMLKACLNGWRSPSEHPALPTTPAAIAKDAAAVVAAGADALHVHPKGDDGADTLEPQMVAEVVDAVRAAVPGIPVGVTTGAWTAHDSGVRLGLISQWTVLPDFASVNWHEPGAQSVAELLLSRDIGVEVGLFHPAAVASWRKWKLRDRCLRVLVEIVEELPPAEAVAAAGELVDALGGELDTASVLMHGEGTSSWPVLREAIRRGFDLRIGLEDVLVLPDGSPAANNAELVTAALAQRNSG